MVIGSSIYNPPLTEIVYGLLADASVTLSTAALILKKSTPVLPVGPTVNTVGEENKFSE